MLRNKYALGAVISVAVVLLFGGGFLLGNRDDAKPAAKRSAPAGSTNNVIPLGQESAANQTGGLQVNAGGATSLGQLGNNQSSSGAAGGSGAAVSNAPSPNQFAEYEKYKDSQHALFGEIKVGTGAELTSGKKAAVFYKGWLTNGQLFDETRGNTAFGFTMGAHEVIPGWEEGIYGMKAGGTRLVIVPPAVGYGAKGQGPVPPNAVMVFQVELMRVE